jgi:hypothetical protein
MTGRAPTRWAMVITGTVLVLAGCGGSGAKRTADSHQASAPPVCNPQAVEAMARFLKVAPEAIATSKSMGSNATPQCTFAERVSAHQQVQVIANVNSSPAPYQVLRRTIEEAAQSFTTSGLAQRRETSRGWG